MHVRESVPAANNSDQVEASSSQSNPEQKLGNLSANIIPHLFKLYDCTATAADYEIYAPKAVIEDPLTEAYGYSSLNVNPTVFQVIRISDSQHLSVQMNFGTRLVL